MSVRANNTVQVSFQDFKSPYLELKSEFDEAYNRFMTSGWYVLGEEVKAFEAEYAEFCEAEHCVGVGHGLDALRLALHACDIGPGDEVIVPTNTYIATWIAVHQAGATIVPVEPDPASHNLDLEKTARALTRKTKAIMPVNLYGNPCEYDSFLDMADEAKIPVIIDNAQAQGAKFKDRRTGGIADIECHSFYPSKNLGAFGEAGAVTTNNATYADRIRVLRNYGSQVRYFNQEAGYNSRLDELQAAFLRVKLRKLDEWNQKRVRVAEDYLRGFQNLDAIGKPGHASHLKPVWHLFVLTLHDRDRVQQVLKDRKIQTLIHYPVPPHLSEAFSHLQFSKGNFPIAERLAEQVLSLPICPFKTETEIQAVIQSLVSCFQGS